MHPHAYMPAGSRICLLHAHTDQVRAKLLIISFLNWHTSLPTILFFLQCRTCVQHDHMADYEHILGIVVTALSVDDT